MSVAGERETEREMVRQIRREMLQMAKLGEKDETVLVGVLKDRRGLACLLRDRWYRIPAAYAPKREFQYLAFYEPAIFGRNGQVIRYYAKVLGRRRLRRLDLLPAEAGHPNARKHYFRLAVAPAVKLRRPIRNTAPRRVTFGFTTLPRLLRSRNILQLYGVAPTEEIIGNALRQAGLRASRQQYVPDKANKHKYFLDFAVFCRRGKIAIECDNRRAHAGAKQKRKDAAKDSFLHRDGWTVVRLDEKEIVYDPGRATERIRRAVRRLGGIRPPGAK